MSDPKRRGVSWAGFVAWWVVRGVARQVGLDVRSQAKTARVGFHELMLRRLHRLPRPARVALFGAGVTARAGWRLARHGDRTFGCALRAAMIEGPARHAEWVERRDHPRGSTGRDHVVAEQQKARDKRLTEHRIYSGEVHDVARHEVRLVRQRAAARRLRVIDQEIKVARAAKNTALVKRLEQDRRGAAGRLTREEIARDLGILPVAAAAALRSVASPSPGPTPATVSPGPVPPGPAVAPVTANSVPAPAATTPAPKPKATRRPVTAVVTPLPIPAPSGADLNGHHKPEGGTPIMTAPTTTPVGEVTTIDEALTAYEAAIAWSIQASDEQAQAADAAEAMVALFEGAAGNLNLDDDSGSEIAQSMEQLRRVAELTKALTAAAADTAALLSNHQKALDARYAFRERVAALKGGDAMQLATLKAS